MFQDLDDVDFARQEFVDVVFRRASLGDDLDGDVALVSFGVGQLHHGVRALSERLEQTVAVRLEHRLAALVVDVFVVRVLPSGFRRHRQLYAADLPPPTTVNLSAPSNSCFADQQSRSLSFRTGL